VIIRDLLSELQDRLLAEASAAGLCLFDDGEGVLLDSLRLGLHAGLVLANFVENAGLRVTVAVFVATSRVVSLFCVFDCIECIFFEVLCSPGLEFRPQIVDYNLLISSLGIQVVNHTLAWLFRSQPTLPRVGVEHVQVVKPYAIDMVRVEVIDHFPADVDFGSFLLPQFSLSVNRVAEQEEELMASQIA